MSKYMMLLVLILLTFSCKKETIYQTQILLKNSTETDLTITLFPKKEYLNGNLYSITDIGSGYRETEFEMTSDTVIEVDLYKSDNLNINPQDLTLQIFDSIYIKSSADNKTIIKFTPDSAIGYKENPFDENSIWNYELRKYDLPKSLSHDNVESHDYIFTISNNNLIN